MSLSGFAPVPTAIRLFCFQAVWLSHDTFDDFVTKNWIQEAPVMPFQVEFAEKLKRWYKEEFHNVFIKKV